MLIDNWTRAWRMVSVQLMALAALIEGTWLALSPEQQALVLQHLPPDAVHWVTLGLTVCGIVGRLVKQPALHE